MAKRNSDRGPTGRRKHHAFGTSLGGAPGAEQDLRIVGRLWIEREGETVISYARATLLERIEETGSIAAASRSMDMSYTKAWRMVKEMNALFDEPLVINRAGGLDGGGAELSAKGRETVDRFWKMVARFKEWLAAERY